MNTGNIPIDEAISLYDQLWTLKALGKRYGKDPGFIRRLLVSQGVRIRSVKEAANILKKQNVKAYAYADEICEKYEKGKTKQILGDEYGCSPNTIIKILKENGIQTRTKSEANKLSYKLTLKKDLQETKPDHEGICDLYKKTKSLLALEKNFKYHRGLLIQILKHNGLSIYKSFHEDYRHKKGAIKRAYDKGKSIQILATEYNVSVMTMQRYFTIHNIKRRPQGRGIAFRITHKDEAGKIREAYQNNEETKKTLAKKYGVSEGTISNYLMYFNIKKRP